MIAGPSAEPAAPLASAEYRLVADGKTDNAAVLQRMVDDGLGTIRLPRGVYRITRPITVDLDRSGWTALTGDGTATLLMAGAGPAVHFRGTHQKTADPPTVADNVWLRQRAPAIDGLEIVGDHPQAEGVRLEGTMQALLTRLIVRHTQNAVVLTGRNRNVIVSDCHLYDNRGAGLLLDHVNLHQINVANCHISYNRQGGIVVRASEVRNLQIGTCDIEANMDEKGPPAANVLLDAREGSIREGAITGCTLQHSHTAPGSANIRLLGCSAPEPQKVGVLSIVANHLSDAEVNVDLRYARDVILSGNTFLEGLGHDLRAEGCAHVSVGQNIFDRHPDYQAVQGNQLIELIDCEDCTLSGLQVDGARGPWAGVVLAGCRRMALSGSTIAAGPCAVLLDKSQQVRVTDCTLRAPPRADGPGIALLVMGGRDNLIAGNTLEGSVEISAGAGQAKGNHSVTSGEVPSRRPYTSQ